MNFKRQDLGCTYSFDRTVFKVWSPEASGIRVQLYKTGCDCEEGAQKLESYGFKNVGMWSMAQASSMMGIIAGNNWRVPHYINPVNYQPA